MYTFLDQELVSCYYAESAPVVRIFCLPPGLGPRFLAGDMFFPKAIMWTATYVDVSMVSLQINALLG